MTDSTVNQARTDVAVFAQHIIGEPLWPHQLEVCSSAARVRVICSGRQAGKSRTLAVLALHCAYVTPGARVLVLSAGEEAAKDLLAEIAGLAQAPLLSGSVVDETKAQLVLSNGSWIRSVPASEKQIRGKSVDLLILDEAAFIDESIWRAARWTIVARPGSRVVMASTPWGRQDRFFAVQWRSGCNGVADTESFHWPSMVSPLVDRTLVEMWRSTSTDREFAAEVLAEWVDEAGAYFTSAELEGAVADYRLVEPGRANGQFAVAGVDWGFAHDANTLVVLGVLADDELNVAHGARPVFFLPWLEEHFRMPYSRFIDRVVEAADPTRGGFFFEMVASETNGVGQMPTEELRERLWNTRGRTWVEPVHTDARRKENAFGMVKLLLQQGRLVLPRHPALLRQLAALEFETAESGLTRIAVPERAGHDDLAMALAQAVSMVGVTRVEIDRFDPSGRLSGWSPSGRGEVLVSGVGTEIYSEPSCRAEHRVFRVPRGGERMDAGW